MVIVIYTKLGALNMVIRMTEKTCGLYENTEVIVETVYIYIYIYIPLRGFNINHVLIQHRNISEVLFSHKADGD